LYAQLRLSPAREIMPISKSAMNFHTFGGVFMIWMDFSAFRRFLMEFNVFVVHLSMFLMHFGVFLGIVDTFW